MADETEYKKINSYINKGIIQSNIEYANHSEGFVSVAKIYIKIDLSDAYTYKDLFGYLHSQTDYGAILLQSNSEIILLFREYKIHPAKAILSKIQHEVSNKFNINIKAIGLTLIDQTDEYDTLISRLDGYYMKSKVSTKDKIFYGTKYFDFDDKKDNLKALQPLFKKLNMIKIHNLYEGIPVVNTTGIMSFKNGNLILKIEKNMIPFYKYEGFCFLEHDLVPNIIKATIMKVNSSLKTLTLTDLEFLDRSAIDRSNIRVEPGINIFVTLSHDGKDISRGKLVNISENSLVFAPLTRDLQHLSTIDIQDKYIDVKMQIPTQKGFSTTVKSRANIFRIDAKQVVVTIFPSSSAKAKIRSFISKKQTELLMQLKLRLQEE